MEVELEDEERSILVQTEQARMTAAQVEALLRIDRHVDKLQEEMDRRFNDLENVIWKRQNGWPGLVPTVVRLRDQMDSILRWLRAIGIAATLAFLSTISLIVAERMANGN